MKITRIASILLLLTLPYLSSCRDVVSPEPLGAQTAELQQIQTLLEEVVTRLDSLETRSSASDSTLSAQVAAIASVVGADEGVSGSVGGSAVLEASICGTATTKANARFRSSVTLRGQGDGMLGVDGYGNGATGRIQAFGGQMVSVIPSGGTSGHVQLCAKLTGGGGVSTGSSSASADGPAGVIDPADPVHALLEELTESVGTSGLSDFASARNMDGSRLGQALGAMSSFSLSDVPFGGGGAANLVNTLPLPSGMATLLNDPSSVLDQAAEAATYAVDQVCGSALQVGEFADLVQSGCDLRDQVPAPGTVIDIFSGLDGVAPSIASLEAGLSSVCNTVDSVLDQDIDIAGRSITILNNTYTTFQGYEADLFPGLAAPNC